MGRSPCCVKEGLNRGAWTSQEDKILKDYIKVHGEGKWRSLPKRAGLKRCGKSCRLRWLNYLRPDIKRGNITNDEEDLIIRLHKLLGNRWSLIAGRLPGRTDNEIKNYWNTNISKRVHNDQVQDRENNHNLVRCRGRNRDHHHSNSATYHHHHHRNSPPTTSHHESAKKNLSSSSINNKSEKVYNNINNNGPLSPPIREGSYVVRTKASRCTKVFINAEVDQIPDTTTTINNNMEIMKAPSIINSITTTTVAADHIDATTQPQLVPTFLREDDININISSADHQFGLMEEDDDKFLSEFLSSTTTPFDDFVDLGFEDINLLLPTLTPDNIPSSQNADQTTSISDQEEQEEEVNDQQNYSDELGSMASLLDPALDWLHDE